MNARNYRLIFSKRLGMLVPVSEIDHAHGKRRDRKAKVRLAATLFSVLVAPAWAAAPAPTEVPTGANVRYGNIGIAQTGNTLNINQSSQNGIIHWNTFNIGSAATVNFNQPNVSAATLNRIVGNEASVIQGALNATGAVYVINRNGILFDKGAQINLHTLVASTLDIKNDELFKNGFLTASELEPAFSDAYTQYVGTAPVGMVQVAEGASIAAATGGRVILLAPDVENKGIVTTDTGQVILAAGHKAYFHLTNVSDSSTLLRGLLVEVGSGGSAVNLGELAAKQGDVTLIGKLVKQDGVISATSSVNLNGTVHLLAREVAPGTTTDIFQPSGNVAANATGSVEFGENSRTVILPALDAAKVKLALAAGTLTQAQVDAYHRGAATVADFYAYMPDTTLQDAQSFNASQIKAEGRDIWVRQNALLRAPGGSITLQALGAASVDPLKVFLTNPNDPGSFALNGLCPDCRVQIDDGAVLDVSGLRDVAVDMERNVVEVELRGSVLADSPLLHDTAGPLYGKKVKVDIRDTGTVDVDGQSVTRQGTTLADASAYIAQIGRRVDEKMTAGGKVNLYSEGALVVRKNASIDLSGGSLAYRTGKVATSQLLYQGKAYDIATAKADLAYTGLGEDRVVTEQGYREGKDAGALTIVAPWVALQGELKGGTVIGERQRGTSGAPLPKGATLKLGIDNPAGPDAGRDYRTLNEIVFARTAQSAAPDHATALSDELKRTLVLDAAKLKAANIANLTVYTNNAIRLESGQTLDMGPGGSVNLTGASLDILGDIKTPGGSVNLGSVRTVYNLAGGNDTRADDLAATQGVDHDSLDQHIAISGDIVTAGLWTNDALVRNAAGPVALDGGNIVITSQGLIELEADGLLDASAGGWLKVDGKTWAAGKGGDITLTDSRPIDATEPMRLAGELRSYGLLDSSLKASRGGKLTLSTLRIGIGGAAPAQGDAGELWLSEAFFQQGGFSNFAVTGANGLDVADASVLAPRALTQVLDSRRLASASGASIAGISRATQLAWGVAKAERPTTSLSLSATTDDFGSLRIGKQARIDLDPRASLNLTAVRGLSVEGALYAPAGAIQLELKTANGSLGYLADAAIWLGDTASISAQGVARTYAGANGQLQGEVLAGGSIALLAHNGYLVAEPGSLLDVSGTAASLDLPRQGGATGFARTLLASAGGSLRLAAAEGIFLGAGLNAAGGSSVATRGSLSVELDRPDIPADDLVGNDYLTGVRSILLYAGNPVFPAYLDTPGDAIDGSDNGIAALNVAMLEKFDHVSLNSRDRIVFEDSLDLELRGRLNLNAAAIEVAGDATVSLDALAIALGNADPLYQSMSTHVPAPTAGSGTFTVHAGLIDLIGNGALSGVAQVNLNSDADIRLTGVVTNDDTTLTPTGSLTTAGGLKLTAAQVYPTTLSHFTLESVGTDARIGVYSNGSTAAVPLSAGGAVTLKADYIDQNGVLRAPLGSIKLDANKTLTLFKDSLTSVSAEGSLIPYGQVVNGQSWIYDLNVGSVARQRTVFSGADGSVNLPTKDVQLKGDSIDHQDGAVVDLSGGGDLYGYEFTPGSGGSSDYLAKPGVYAILPAGAAQAAPFDFQYAQYAYASAQGTATANGRVLGTGASQQVKAGDSVYLSDIPELNIKAGYYTLLPAHYALLPGAVAVRAVANTQDMTSGQNNQRSDGSYLVAGYRSSLGDADVGQTRWSGFEVASRQVIASRSGFEFQYSAAELKSQKPSGRSEIHDYLASQLIPGIAALYDLALPKLGPDAGRLGIDATSSLKLDGDLDFEHATPGSLGGELDIASSRIAVTDGGAPQVDNPGDYLVLDVDLLNGYAVDSLMLGGTREAVSGDVGSVMVNQVADALLIETSAAKPLSAPEIMLVSKGSITLAAGSEVRGAGSGSARNETLLFGQTDVDGSGDGVLVRVSSGDLRSVVRRGVGDDGGGAVKGLYTGENASVYGEKSVNLDATFTAFNLGKVSLGAHAALQLGARRIALGQVDEVIEGVFVTNALLASLGNPDDVVLKSYSNFDVHGDAALGSANASSLSFEGAGFASLKPGQFDVTAKTVRFANPDGGSLKDVADAVGGGIMHVSADNILFGAGQVTAAGFAEVRLQARGDIAGVAKDAGKLADGSDPQDGLTATGDLSLTAQRITGYNGSDVALHADGLLTTARYAIAAGETRLGLGDAPLGGRLALSGASVNHGGNIELPAGSLDITAESGDLQLLAGSNIFTGGVVRQFRGVDDTVEVPVAGGTTHLVAETGDLSVEQGATVDVSGRGGADAGRLKIVVPEGAFSLRGNLKGTAEATVAEADPWQGAFSLDVHALDDGDAATANDFSELLQHMSGFGESFSLRQRSGDLLLAADDTIQAGRVVLSADDGVLDIAGRIDARAAEGGWVMAAAGKELYLRDGAEIDASATGTAQRGGEVYLISGMNDGYVAAGGDNAGALVLEKGSTIAVGGTLAAAVSFAGNAAGDADIVLNQATGGRVHLQAPRMESVDATPLLYSTITAVTFTSNTYKVSYPGASAATTALQPGTVISFEAPAKNTGSVKISIGGLLNKPLLSSSGGQVANGAIAKNSMVYAVWDGTNFRRMDEEFAAHTSDAVLASTFEHAGSSDRYTVDGTNAPVAGATLVFTVAATNTQKNVLLNVGGVDKALTNAAGTSIGTNSLRAGDVLYVFYDGSKYRLAAEANVPLDTGSANQYTVTLANAGAIAVGDTVAFQATTANSSASRLDILDAGGNVILSAGLKSAGADLTSGTIKAKDILYAYYDGTNFQLMSENQSRRSVGSDVRITKQFGSYAQAGIGSTITGAAQVEAIANRVVTNGTVEVAGTVDVADIHANSLRYQLEQAGTAKARLSSAGIADVLQVRAGTEVRSAGDLIFASDFDFGGVSAAANNQPGTLTLRAAGKLLVNGNLSDGFNSATGMTLDSGDSWSYRLAAGADLTAADPMAVLRNLEAGIGDFVLKGGKLIRTGTGSIQVAAGGDVKIGLNSDDSYNRASVIYTAGRTDGNAAAFETASDLYFKKVGYGVDGGALAIDAAGSVVAPEYGQLTNNWLQRRGTTDSAGNIVVSPTWGVAYEYFNQGVGALGGGNVRIEAGRNIDNLSVSLPTTGRDYAAESAGSKLFETGGGSAEMHADGDIHGSFLYVQKGAGRVTAGGAIGAMPATDLDSDTADNRNLILALGDSRIQVFARNGLVLETAFNPTVAATGTLAGSLDVPGSYKSSSNTDFFTYGEASGIRLVAAQGDLRLSNDRARIDESALFVSEVYGGNAPNFMTGTFVYPGSLTAAAVNGSVEVGNSFALYPAGDGRFHLLAHEDVTFSGGVSMSDVDAARLPSIQAPSKGFEAADNLLFSIQDTAEYHSPTLTHLNDTDPVRIYAETGSIEYVPENSGDAATLNFPKPVEMLAGRDILDLSLTAQHVSAGQTSTIWAGRDIRYQPLRVNGNLANNGSGIQVDGPGYLDVAAGRNIDLGSTAGIMTNGNLKNPALAAGGAHITVSSGTGVDADGRPVQPAYAAFAAGYLNADSAALSDFAASVEDFEIRRAAMLLPENVGLDYAEVQTKLSDSAYRAGVKHLAESEITAALAAFDALPLAAKARRIFYHELEMAGVEANQGLGYARAENAIAAFFPDKDAAGDPLAYAGNLSVFFSQIRTNQGGDIELLTPGGSVAVGLISNPTDLASFRKDADLGLFTVNGGGIRSYSSDDFSVNTSRVFTLGQEKKALRTTDFERLLRDDIMLFSLLGDIDAGKGAKTATAAPPPTYEYDNMGNLKVNLANSIAGSGIGVLLAREVIVPGDVSLIAPSGAVNAGDAGIRASGNLNIAAAHVIGADNIQVSGLSIGVPVAVDTGGLSVSGIGSLGDATQSTGEATRSLGNTAESAQKSAEEMKQAMASFKPSFITVEVLGYGDGTASIGEPSDDAVKQEEERRRRRGA